MADNTKRDRATKTPNNGEREDGNGLSDDFLRREGYCHMAHNCWWFLSSSFLYSLAGLYLFLTAEVMRKKWWYIEAAALVIQGPISYWNDVYCFGLDKIASTVDRCCATMMFLLQALKVFLLPMDLLSHLLFASAVCSSLVIFFIGSSHFGDLLSAAGNAAEYELNRSSEDDAGALGGDTRTEVQVVELQQASNNVAGSNGKMNDSTLPSSVGVIAAAAHQQPKDPNQDAPSSPDSVHEATEGARSREDKPGVGLSTSPSLSSCTGGSTTSSSCASSSVASSSSNYKTSSSDSIQQMEMTSTSCSAGTGSCSGDSGDVGEKSGSGSGYSQLTIQKLLVEKHFNAYLYWHTLWHVSLPVPAMLLLAGWRLEMGEHPFYNYTPWGS
ncbi:unnamed protein product [Amoebophrya sp. A25]|nr:unnamed protein product [Amoebophrya sp. A25]|eukprot:GSA25T00006821001.1